MILNNYLISIERAEKDIRTVYIDPILGLHFLKILNNLGNAYENNASIYCSIYSCGWFRKPK